MRSSVDPFQCVRRLGRSYRCQTLAGVAVSLTSPFPPPFAGDGRTGFWMGDPASVVNGDVGSPVNPWIKSGERDNSKVRRNNSSSCGVVAEPDQILFLLLVAWL